MTGLIKRYVSLPLSLWSILAIQCLMNLSYFMSIPILAIYMAGDLGLSPSKVGVVMAAHIVARQSLPAVSGFLVDRFGSRIFMFAGPLLRAGGVASFCYVDDWMVLSLVAIVIGSGSALYDSAAQGLIARYPPVLAARGLVVNYQMLNLGAVAGPLIGAWLLLVDLKAVFLASAGLFALLAVASLRLGVPDGHHGGRVSVRLGMRRILRNVPFMILCIAGIPWWFLMAQLFAAFPLHFEAIAGANLVPWIFTVNAIVGILFMPVSMMAMERRSPVALMLIAYAGLAGLCVVMPMLDGGAWFLVFIAAFSLVEIVIVPAIEVSAIQQAERGSETSYLGMACLASAVGGGAGYYLDTPIALQSPVEFWILMSVTAIAGGLVVGAYLTCDPGRARRPAE